MSFCVIPGGIQPVRFPLLSSLLLLTIFSRLHGNNSGGAGHHADTSHRPGEERHSDKNDSGKFGRNTDASGAREEENHVEWCSWKQRLGSKAHKIR